MPYCLPLIVCWLKCAVLLFTVSSARAKFGTLMNQTQLLEDKAAVNKQLGQDISHSLDQLRDRIQQARAQAQSVSISHGND